MHATHGSSYIFYVDSRRREDILPFEDAENAQAPPPPITPIIDPDLEYSIILVQRGWQHGYIDFSPMPEEYTSKNEQKFNCGRTLFVLISGRLAIHDGPKGPSFNLHSFVNTDFMRAFPVRVAREQGNVQLDSESGYDFFKDQQWLIIFDQDDISNQMDNISCNWKAFIGIWLLWRGYHEVPTTAMLEEGQLCIVSNGGRKVVFSSQTRNASPNREQ
ncbi:hypothetical protein V8E53_010351 [Lactarius tabidus]